MEDANEDGYNIVHNFNEADDFSFHGENPKRLFDVFCSYPLTHDFAVTICGFLILVDSPSVRNAAKLKMKDFLQRLTNALLNATFVFLREGLVVYIFSKASFIYLNIEISMTEEGHEVNTSSECFHSSPWL